MKITESMIHSIAAPESFRRGREYYRQGAVVRLVRRGEELQAEVEGTEPYLVSIQLTNSGLETACTCPYAYGGACKHVVAALLAYIHQPEMVEEKPDLASLLSDLDREQLVALLSELTSRRPELADIVESLLVRAVSKQPGTPPPPARVDAAAVRRRVRAAVHSLGGMRASEAYWHVPSVVQEMSDILQEAWSYIEVGDGRAALEVLRAITSEYAEDWTLLDDSDGDAGGFFSELGPAWTEAILSADLSPRERDVLADELDAWRDELADYGIDDVFDAAIAAAEQGWDYAAISTGRDEDERPWYQDELTLARLNVLRRQGRTEEYLRLAREEDLPVQYATMLVEVGRYAEAAEYARQQVATAEDMRPIASALWEKGEYSSALDLAKAGLNKEGPKRKLALWLRDAATGQGQHQTALKAATIAFEELPNLQEYELVEQLAAGSWPEYRETLLTAALRPKFRGSRGAVEVLLREGLIDEAIEAVKDAWDDSLVADVAAAALDVRPEWVIAETTRRAEAIMESGDAAHYADAVDWLEKARDAYVVAGRDEDWHGYLQQTIERHRRKYKLRPMLEALE